jgi:cell division protein FtsL
MMKKFRVVFSFLIFLYATNIYAQSDAVETVIDTAVLDNLQMNTYDIATEDEKKEQILAEQFDSIQNIEVLTEGRVVADSAWRRLIKDEKLSYIEKIEKKKIEKKIMPKEKSKSDGKTEIVLLFSMIALVIVMIIYAFFGKKYFKNKQENVQQEILDFENVDTFSEWEKSINEAVANQDYRLAIRILYLQTLQILNDKNKIIYRKEFPNSIYLAKLFNTSLYLSFYELTRYFDYVWYGRYTVSQNTYHQAYAQFQIFQNSIT